MVSPAVAIAVLCLVVVYVVLRIVHFLKVRNVINRLPGPHSHYVLGNLLDVYGDSETMFRSFRRFGSKYKIYRIWFGHVGVVCITDPEDSEAVISGMRNLEKSRSYEPLMPWLNTGLLTSSGAKWHTRRKLLTPSFHFNILQQFINVFGKQTELLLDEMEGLCGKEINVSPVISSFTLRTICETAMGIRFDIQKELQQTYETNLQKMGNLLVHRIMRPWMYVNAFFPLFPTFWNQQYVAHLLHKFSGTIIQKRKDNFVPLEPADVKRKLAMLDLLLSNNKAIDMDGIREEVDTFVFEGHDTTSTSLAFTLMLLANHKEIQDKVYREIIDVFGPSSSLPTHQDLQNLSYMEMCIKESLRLYPSVPLVGRLASQDLTTPSGFVIPKGVEILVHIYDLHRNSDIYPDPEKFDPDRFLPENTADRHPFAYLPFSGGPRNCIGQKFAMAEMKTFIAGVLRKFVIEPVDTQSTVVMMQDILLRTKEGVKIKLKLRKDEVCETL